MTNGKRKRAREHVVVWVKGKKAMYAATSAHGDYTLHETQDLRILNGTHVKIVYHMDYKRTRNMRIAKPNDEPPENHFRQWIDSRLVSWEGFPSKEIRQKLQSND